MIAMVLTENEKKAVTTAGMPEASLSAVLMPFCVTRKTPGATATAMAKGGALALMSSTCDPHTRSHLCPTTSSRWSVSGVRELSIE